MLSQPLTLNEDCVRGRGLPAAVPPPLLSLAEDMRTQAGPPAPPPPCTTPSCPPPPPVLSSSPSITVLSGSPHASSSSTAPLHPHSSSSAPLHPHSSSAPLHPHSSSSAPLHPHSSSAPLHPHSSAPLHPHSSSAPLHPHSSSAPLHPHSSSAPLHPHSSSSAPLHPHSSSAPLHPHSSSAPLHPHSSSAPLHPHSFSAPLHPHSFSAPLHPHSFSAPLHPPSSSLMSPSVFSDSPCVPLTSDPPPLSSAPARCSCSSILPRLLAAHRLEVRRLLRGTLASLSRRLDSLERSTRRKRRRRRRGGIAPAPPTPTFTPAVPGTSCSTSSSSDRMEHSTGEPGGVGSRSVHRGGVGEGEEEGEEEEEEEEGRFVGRMAVSFTRGADEEEQHLLTLHTFLQPICRRREDSGVVQSEDTNSVAMTTNGYATPLLLLRSDSQHALHRNHSVLSHWTDSQSDAVTLSPSQWCFSKQTTPVSSRSTHNTAHMWLSSSRSFSPAPMLHLSVAAVGLLLDAVRGGAYPPPPRPLKDWTASPSLSADHCYVQTVRLSPWFVARRQQRRRNNHSAHPVHRLCGRSLSANGLCAPSSTVQSAASVQFPSTNRERKRVSQIRIRRASPRETLLTPMGLPKVKRLKKKEFSLEEIYTNKNYKSPSANRSLETIFEEPREKDGSLLLIGQQKRRRLLLFPDFTQPRKRKKLQGVGLAVAMAPRKRTAARRHVHCSDDDCDLDVMLVERLSALEDFLSRQGLDT